jgi:hypothetical protein
MSKYDSLIGQPGLERTSQAFRRALVAAAQEIGTEPDYLATVIAFESGGTFDSAVRNPLSACVGLIQFCGPAAIAAASRAGHSMSKGDAQSWLAAMTPEEQLLHVVRYFLVRSKGKRDLTLEQTYLLVFAPAHAFKDLGAAAYSRGTREYTQNEKMDLDNDGRITVGDISKKIRSKYDAATSRPRVPVEGGSADVADLATAGVGGSTSGKYLAIVAGTTLGYYVISQYVGKRRA